MWRTLTAATLRCRCYMVWRRGTHRGPLGSAPRLAWNRHRVPSLVLVLVLMKRLSRTVIPAAIDAGRRALRYLRAVSVATWSRAHRGTLVPGLLSIVVPAHNVEPYIDECLHSLRRQAYRKIEVIVVDDGSQDASGRIGKRHRLRDPRIRVLTRPNGGPSAARNAGVAAARGEFLTFVDPDDLVRPEGLRRAIATLRETHSDFAVLSYDRMRAGRRQQPGLWIVAAHATRRLRCTIDSAPDIQVNAVVWSKVFRRSFYDAAGIRFPEGAIYEDQPVSARAYARARSFDILTEVGVSWRVRDEGTSITQQTSSTDNLVAHNAAVHWSLDELDAAGHAAAADTRALQLLANNMRLFIRHVDAAEDTYWRALQEGLRELLDRVTYEAYVGEVPAQEKVLNALIMADDHQRARHFVRVDGMRIDRFPTHLDSRGRYVARLPFFEDRAADIPTDSFVLADRQLATVAMITNVHWDLPTVLIVDGWAYVTNVDLAHHTPAIEVRAVDSGGRRISLETSQHPVDDSELLSMHAHADYRNGGFTARLRTDELEASCGPWSFAVEVVVPGRSGVAALTRTSPSCAVVLSSRRPDGVAFLAGPVRGKDFGLQVARDSG